MTQSPKQMSAAQVRKHSMTEARPTKIRRLDVRLSSTEHARIVEDAMRRGLSMSTHVRQALLGQVGCATDRDARLVAALVRALDTRAEALAETTGEIALTLLERMASEPISPEARAAYIAGAVECFRDALRRHLQDGTHDR